MEEIFVFGSNLAGIHGAGSAKCAFKEHQARYGVGYGPTGNAFAIPTKDHFLNVLPLSVINNYVNGFINYANLHPEFIFKVVRIGCGLAGYKDSEIAPMFKAAPSNCLLPSGWR